MYKEYNYHPIQEKEMQIPVPFDNFWMDNTNP